MKLKKAFTMAEAILVMTILGIIATIMISTLKPAEFKEKGLAVLAKKVLSEIDTATTQILLNNSSKGNMATLYVPGSTVTTFSTATANTTNSGYLGTLYKKYLTATRTDASTDSPCKDYDNKFFLKDGACIGIKTGAPAANVNTWFPGEATLTTAMQIKPSYGYLFFDINGNTEPNVMGRDQFILPFNEGGIHYSD